MKPRIAITDLAMTRDLGRTACRAISGRGVSTGYLFASPAGRSGSAVVNQFFNFETFEINQYETNNYIDKMINQTVNNSQLNRVSVQAGDAQVNVNVNQAQMGSNALG